MRRNIKIKWIVLILLVALSYTFNATSGVFFYTNVYSKLLPERPYPLDKYYHFEFRQELHTEWLHWVGFIILSWIYGWIILLIAILDEVAQLFVPGRVMDIKDMLRNMGGAGIGLILNQFLHIRIGRREWKKKTG